MSTTTTRRPVTDTAALARTLGTALGELYDAAGWMRRDKLPLSQVSLDNAHSRLREHVVCYAPACLTDNDDLDALSIPQTSQLIERIRQQHAIAAEDVQQHVLSRFDARGREIA